MPPPVLTPGRRLGRPARAAVTAALSAVLLAAATVTAPASQARPLDPDPTVPIPGPSARAADPGAVRPGGGRRGGRDDPAT
jgi:hypothetical protein